MSEAKHTPGPWRHDTSGNLGNVVAGPSGKQLYEGDNGYRAVAIVQACTSSNLYSEEEANQQANINLIAAAPDLLAALRGALPFLVNDASPGGCTGEFPDCDHCVAIRSARAAIAKAEGLADRGG